MRDGGEGNTDLVISMTLAEIFLLMLFVIWWGADLESTTGGKDPVTVQLHVLEAEKARLTKELVEANGRIARLTLEMNDRDARLEALRAMLGASSTDTTAFRQALERQKADVFAAARRGSPKCRPSNTLVSILVKDGAVQLTVLCDDVDVLSDLKSHGAGELQTGMTLSSTPQVNALLAAVTEYYASHPECRFDYRLSFQTADDYKLARTKFEQFFYPERITALQH